MQAHMVRERLRNLQDQGLHGAEEVSNSSIAKSSNPLPTPLKLSEIKSVAPALKDKRLASLSPIRVQSPNIHTSSEQCRTCGNCRTPARRTKAATTRTAAAPTGKGRAPCLNSLDTNDHASCISRQTGLCGVDPLGVIVHKVRPFDEALPKLQQWGS